METFWQDVKYGARRLVKNPGFTLVAVLSLALGIGATSAIFSLVNAIFLQPVPIADPQRVVAVAGTDSTAAATGGPLYDPLSYPNYLDLQKQAGVFSGMAGYVWVPLSVAGRGGEPELIFGQMVTGNYFDVLGVKAAVGRTFLPEEDATLGGPPVTVLSYSLWQRRFGADPGVIGQSILVNNNPFTVIGVMPRGFRGPTTFGAVDLWVATAMRQQVFAFSPLFEQRRWRLLNVFGRLRPGVGFEQANAAVATVGERLQKEYPAENPGRSFILLRLTESGLDPNQRPMILRAGAVLFATSVLVLLIACANVANLLLARSASRRREIAVRLSLGVTRGRLIRQLVTESLLLALISGVLGVFLGLWGRDLLWRLRPPIIPVNAIDFSLNPRILFFALLAALLSGLLFGLVPALRASRPQVVSDLKNQAGETEGGRRLNLRNLLVVAQVAIAIVTLIGAGLFLRSLRNAQQVDAGFEPENLVAAGFNLATQGYPPERGMEFQRRVAESLRALPEVEAVTLAQSRPVVPVGLTRSILAEGQENPEQGLMLGVNAVDLGYFKTLGIPLRQGRDFQESDAASSRPVAIVNETLARRLWPGDAVGRRFTFAGEPEPVEIVGVARDSKYRSLSEEPQPFVYTFLRQRYSPMVEVLVRTRVSEGAALEPVRRELRRLDPNLPLINLQTMQETMALSQWGSRMVALLLSFFGALTLVLAVMGIYSVLSYSVRLRRREIGIRSALGASRRNLAQMVVVQAALFVAIGAGLGLAGAFAASHLAKSLLFEVSVTDPLTFAGVPLLLAAVALVASLVPAVRAARTDPLVAIRGE